MIQPMSYGYPYGVKLDPKTLEEMQEKRNRMYVKMFYIQSNVYILQSCWPNFMLIIMNTTISFNSVYLFIQLLRICCNYMRRGKLLASFCHTYFDLETLLHLHFSLRDSDTMSLVSYLLYVHCMYIAWMHSNLW